MSTSVLEGIFACLFLCMCVAILYPVIKREHKDTESRRQLVYEQGYTIGKLGEELSTNPYQEHQYNYAPIWVDGWIAGNTEYRKEQKPVLPTARYNGRTYIVPQD